MDNRKERLRFLLKSYIDSTITAEQLKELSNYLNQGDAEATIDSLMKDYWDKMDVSSPEPMLDPQVYQKTIQDARFKADRKRHFIRMPTRKFLKYAAAVVLLLNAALIFIYNQQEVKQPVAQVVQQHKPVQHEEQSKKAMLTLGDGSKLVLGEAENRKLAVEGTSNIQDQNGQLVYRAAGLPALSNLNLHHTITTPKGVTYQLILQDGTKIWLNTASTITYPVAFNGATRNVKITGEAYFEVAKNKRQPFIINANGTNIKVLGTAFNISAYAEDKSVKTTLLEGAVEVSKNNKQVTLVPDQQAVVSNAGDDMAVLKVDAAEAVAWKKGYFIFHHDDIKTVMQTIARWYDVEVEYRGDMTGKTFAGTIARFDTIEKLLKSLALTEAVNFKMEGRRVIVMP